MISLAKKMSPFKASIFSLRIIAERSFKIEDPLSKDVIKNYLNPNQKQPLLPPKKIYKQNFSQCLPPKSR